jgi:hypothetical protein
MQALYSKNMKEFGDKETLCFAIGKEKQGKLQEINIWAKHVLLTPIDNMAYLPQFIATLEAEKLVLASGQIAEEFLYFNHGPTTDDLSGKISLQGNKAYLTFSINGILVSLVIETLELVSIYSQTIKYLRSMNA